MHKQKQLNATTTKEHEFCLRCGRKLKSMEARQRGMGLICWNKSSVTDVQKPLFYTKSS